MRSPVCSGPYKAQVRGRVNWRWTIILENRTSSHEPSLAGNHNGSRSNRPWLPLDAGLPRHRGQGR